jgi:hypothetical protein
MKRIIQNVRTLSWPGYGQAALAAFVICAVSGIALAIPYDVNRPYNSISLFVLLNPWASFFRNLHYWSAQFVLVGTLLHAWAHFKPESVVNLKPGIWYRLSFSLLFLFYVMISGFILKGDSDSEQALTILTRLLSLIPLAGKPLSTLLLGNVQLIYVHHIATATLVLVVIIFEHARILWSRAGVSLSLLLLTGFLALFLQAPLHDGQSAIMKGPWYFLAVQEILHYLTYPGFLLILVLLLFLPVLFFKRFVRYAAGIRRITVVVVILYGLLTITAAFFRGENWKWVLPWQAEAGILHGFPRYAPVFSETGIPDTTTYGDFPMVAGRPESCLVCHGKMTGFEKSHDPAAIGCSSCHGGNTNSAVAGVAHRGMRLVPGNLADARISCGQSACHSGIPERVATGLMASLSGMIGVNRWVFGETDSPDHPAHVDHLGESAADMHLRNLCSGCHLGQKKEIPGSYPATLNGGGCLACHLHYDIPTRKSVDQYYSSSGKGRVLPVLHPQLTAKVGNEQCFSCHNRSGRISTNYEGWYESLDEPGKVKPGANSRIIDGYRVFYKTEADVHHTAGLSCIDCHLSVELMGDGNAYKHKEDAVKISCTDCHSDNLHPTKPGEPIDAESQKLIRLNPLLDQDGPYLKNRASGIILTNSYQAETGDFRLKGKINAKTWALKAPDDVCLAGSGHKNLSCRACHTAWAPTCLGCHTTYDAQKEGFDHKNNVPVKGTWTELAGNYGVRPPTLGVKTGSGGKTEVTIFVPGMIMTLDLNSFSGKSGKQSEFIRRYAPADPHTTTRKSRDCKSCHLDPNALGYGEGTLQYQVKNGEGRWYFEPVYEKSMQDGLPADAWIAFLKEPGKQISTRTNYRAFTLAEQKRILLVGTCLTCHAEDSKVAKTMVTHYKSYLKNLPGTCIISGW